MEELKQAARLALERLLALGGEQAAVTASRGETTELSVMSGELTQLRSCGETALVMTVMRQERRGSIRIGSLDRESVLAAAEECMENAKNAEPDPDWGLAEAAETGSFRTGCPEPDREALLLRSRELLETIRDGYPRVGVESFTAEHESSTEYYLNSVGSEFDRTDGGYCFSLEFSAHEGEDCGSFFGSEVMTDRLDRPIRELGTLAYDLSACENSLRAGSADGRFDGTVLLHPDCFGDFLGSAMQLFCEDDCLIEGTSPWRRKLGKRVAAKGLTLSVAPLDPRIAGGERWTGEGCRSGDYVWIENGMLRSFCLSRYGERATGLPRAANGDGCLIAKPGDRPLRELIASVKRGILIGRFSGGDPAPNGDFSGVAKNSFLIENGKIGRALSETMISGNIAELLMKTEALSEELSCDGSDVLPWALVKGMTISG